MPRPVVVSLLMACFGAAALAMPGPANGQAMAPIPVRATPPRGDGTTPMAPSDIYVPGKYDKNGVFVPPHYAAKQKPEFHGYFGKGTTVKHGHFYTKKPAGSANPD